MLQLRESVACVVIGTPILRLTRDRVIVTFDMDPTHRDPGSQALLVTMTLYTQDSLSAETLRVLARETAAPLKALYPKSHVTCVLTARGGREGFWAG